MLTISGLACHFFSFAVCYKALRFGPTVPGCESLLLQLQRNLEEVITMLLADGEPKLEAEFVGTQSIAVAAA